jgi:hypothetical protein
MLQSRPFEGTQRRLRVRTQQLIRLEPEPTLIAQQIYHTLRGHGPFKPRPRQGKSAYQLSLPLTS